MATVRVIVVGGGLTGLAAARRLAERLNILGRPFEITLVEASQRLGGVIATESKNGFLLEQGPDCFLADKPRGTGLCNDLGISRDIIQTQADRRSFIAWQGKLVPVPAGFHMVAPSQIETMLLTPLLSIQGKARLLKELFMPGAPPEDESIASFVRRRFGPEVLERLAQPLAGGIYGADPDKISLRATFPKFLEFEKKGSVIKGLRAQLAKEKLHVSGARYSLFVSLKDGMGSLVKQLQERLPPVRLELNSLVQRIAPTNDAMDGWRIQLADGRVAEADGLCLALPAPILARLLQPLVPSTATALGQIPYADAIMAHFAFPLSAFSKPLQGFGFVVPAAEKRALSACTFVHQKFSGRTPSGYALLRAFVSGAAIASLRSAPNPDIERRLLTDLNAYLKISGKPTLAFVNRYQQAMPQYPVGYLSLLKTIDEGGFAMRNVVLTGNWRRGVGIPDCIENGEQSADSLINSLCRI